MFIFPGGWGDAFVRIGPDNPAQILADIGAMFKKFNPAFPFSYRFVHQEVEALYGKEKTLEQLLNFFALLCIFLSGPGLYALSAFVVREKLKEVAIRRIFGASANILAAGLPWVYLKWVVTAFVLAVSRMSRWLSYYAYHTEIHLTAEAGAFG